MVMQIFGLQRLLKPHAVLLAFNQVLRQVLMLELEDLLLVNWLSPIGVLTGGRRLVILAEWRLTVVPLRILLTSVARISLPRLLIPSVVSLILLRRLLVSKRWIVVGRLSLVVTLLPVVLVSVHLNGKPKKYADYLVVSFLILI